jgi:hypothetical protein
MAWSTSTVSPPPCLFDQTVALRNYNGVHFAGDSPINGGAIVNECGNWGVTGYSSPNFLGFNCQATLSDGGIPRLPEKINLRTESTSVSLKIGSEVPGTVKLVGKGSQGRQRRVVTLTGAMQTVTFTIPVQVIRLTTTDACIFVVDDISF